MYDIIFVRRLLNGSKSVCPGHRKILKASEICQATHLYA